MAHEDHHHFPGEHSHEPMAEHLSEQQSQDLARFFKALGDPTRIKILYLLAQREHCVCEIAEHLDTTMSAVSHQLRLLREARLLRSRREGKQIFYALDDEHVRHLFEQGLEHIQHA